MRLAEDQDHRDLRANLRSFLARHTPMEQIRRVAEGPEAYDAELWKRLCEEFQLAAMCLPEEFGGLAAPWSFQAVVQEELGRTLTPSPYFGSVLLAVPALLAAGDNTACGEWLPRIASGNTTATLAAIESDAERSLDSMATIASPDDGTWSVTGVKPWVVDGGSADVAIVLANTEHGSSLFLVELDSSGVSRETAEPLDLTRQMTSIVFDKAPARLLGELGRGAAAIESILPLAHIALAAEQLGGARRTLEMATDYAKSREQFGRPIGSFQAIKHMLADRLLDNESLAATVRYAAVAVDEAPEEVALLAPICQSVGSEAFFDAASVNIQVHGGIGFTWEHDAHYFFKRATASRQWLGTPYQHRETLASMTLDVA